MPRSGCSALHGVNPNLKKKNKTKKLRSTIKQKLSNCPKNLFIYLLCPIIVQNLKAIFHADLKNEVSIILDQSQAKNYNLARKTIFFGNLSDFYRLFVPY